MAMLFQVFFYNSLRANGRTVTVNGNRRTIKTICCMQKTFQDIIEYHFILNPGLRMNVCTVWNS